MPPSAAINGSIALAGVRSSPAASSRLISIPTRKKNSVISPSLMNSRNVNAPRVPDSSSAIGASNSPS